MMSNQIDDTTLWVQIEANRRVMLLDRIFGLCSRLGLPTKISNDILDKIQECLRDNDKRTH